MTSVTALSLAAMQSDGWLPDATRCPSPNCDDRPAGIAVDLLVIHNISLPPGQYGGGCVQTFFCNALDPKGHPYFAEIKDLQVSAHFLIERSGQLTQFVSTQQRAWHAGQSCFQGRQKCNDFSIGIELEGSDDEAYTDAQYEVLTQLSLRLLQFYPTLDRDNIIGHSDIAPGRKTDPGEAFDWPRYRSALDVAITAAANFAAHHGE